VTSDTLTLSIAAQVEILRAALTVGSGRFYADWAARAIALQRFVYGNVENSAAVTSAEAIETFLANDWALNVVRLPRLTSAATQFHPSRSQAAYLGRFGIRRLSLAQPGDGYIAVDNASYEKRGLWTLLHELGHVAHHSKFFIHVSNAYRQICMEPEREGEIWAETTGGYVADVVERSADIFAAAWLVSDDLRRANQLLSLEGRVLVRLERAVSGLSLEIKSRKAAEEINTAAAESRQKHLNGPYPAVESVASRAAWAAWNVHEWRSNGIALPPSMGPSNIQRRNVNLARVALKNLLPALKYDHWDPILVTGDVRHRPAYYIPIATIPRSGSAVDAGLSWRHMMKAAHVPGKTLGAWLSQVEDGESLMMFPRTPAERALDLEGAFRF
jgi:hypothetical protein